jgi:formylglycine-generating enzyme
MKIKLLSFFLFGMILLSSNKLHYLLPNSMVKIDGGSYMMGSKDEDYKADSDEQKEHEVSVNTFELNKYEVTVWEWKQYVKEKKLKMPVAPKTGFNDKAPINNITWVDAINYCNWLSKKEGLTPVYTSKGPFYYCNFKANGYRLPTEAEWEFAAKGGIKTKKFTYSGGNNLDEVAWHKGNSGGKTQTIGTKTANELGLHDMTGNVWEWCWDWYNKEYYKTETKDNPTGPEMGDKKCVRGGSYDSDKNYLRPANRISTFPDKTHEFYGFRLARTVINK